MLVLAMGFAALIVSTGVYVSAVVTDSVTGEFDAALLMKAQALVQLTEDEGGVESRISPTTRRPAVSGAGAAEVWRR